MAGSALWASPPGVASRVAPLLVTVAMLWAAPAAFGLVLLGLAQLLAPQDMALPVGAIGLALTFSPLVSWIGWLMALPAVWILLRRGAFGWLPAGATGFVAGAVSGLVVDSELAIPFGLLSLLALRAALPVTLRP